MDRTKKRVLDACRRLSLGDRSLREIYRVVFGDRAAVMCERATTLRVHRVTVGEVQARAERIAAALGARFSGERLGLYAENCIEWTVLFWAILRSGSTPVLFPEASDAALPTVRVRAVLTARTEEPLPCETLDYATLLREAEDAPTLDDDAPFGNAVEAVACGEVTSYTGEMLTEQILSTGERILGTPDASLGHRGRMRQLMLLPLSHAWGFSSLYLSFAAFGAVFVFPRSTASDVLLETARRHDVTHLFAPASFWNALERTVTRACEAEGDASRLDRTVERLISLQNSFPRLGRRLAVQRGREWRDLLLPDSVRFCLSVGNGDTQSARRLLNALGYPLYHGCGMDARGLASVALPKRVRARILASDVPLDGEARTLSVAFDASCGSDEVGYTGDGSEIRGKILALFTEILGLSADEIPGDAHFMIDLGGSSLDYFTLIGELDREFGVQLPYENDDFSYSLDDFEQLIKETLKCTNSSVGSL